jgi:signal transduction histidine kinase
MAVAVGVVLIGQLEVWAPAAMRDLGNLHIVGSPALNSLAYLLGGLALVWRRQHPAGVLTFVLLAQSLLALAAGGSQGLGGALPMLIALYSLARWSEGAIARAGLVMALLASMVHDLRDPLVQGVADVLFVYVLIVVDWVAGRGLHTWQRRVGDLEKQAESLRASAVQQAVLMAAEERARIARELHDVVAHHVSLAVIQSVVALELLDAGERARARERIIDGEEASREALSEMRMMIGVLDSHAESDETLAPQPGVAALPQLAARVSAAGVAIDLEVQGSGTNVPVGLDLSAYRIVQEALTNTLKHAHATTAAVRIRYRPDAVEVEIMDNGHPAAVATQSPASGGNGRGLIGMQERAAIFGGSLECGPQSTGGWGVRAYLPIAVTK